MINIYNFWIFNKVQSKFVFFYIFFNFFFFCLKVRNIIKEKKNPFKIILHFKKKKKKKRVNEIKIKVVK